MRHRTAQFIEEQKAAAFALEPKRKPRGKPFPKGNKIGPRFKKGQSANPGGLPGTNVSERIARAVLAKYEPQIIEGLGAKLRAGDGYVFSVVADRADGKLTAKAEITGKDGEPIPVAFTVKFIAAKDGKPSV
jgi:hypothetical protein